MRVMILEDEGPVRSLICTVLREAGMEVASAETAEEGLAALEAPGSSFDAVVSDLMLPDLSGMDLINRLRKTGVPIVSVTGLSKEVVVEELLAEMGIVGVLQKPFESDELIDRLNVASHRKKGPR